MPKHRANGRRWLGYAAQQQEPCQTNHRCFCWGIPAPAAARATRLGRPESTSRNSKQARRPDQAGGWAPARCRALGLLLAGGGRAAETAGAVAPLGKARGIAARVWNEYSLQHLALHGFLDDRYVAEPAVDALDAVPGHEHEGDFSRRQHVGDRIDELSPELDVDDAGV